MYQQILLQDQINPNVIQVHTNVQVFLFNLMLYIKILLLKM